MSIHLEQASEKYIISFRKAVGEVAREKKYLMTTTGFSEEATREFVMNIINNNFPQYYAIDNGVVVGWCDIVPGSFEGLGHVGHLGLGVIRSYRGKGLGRKLLRIALNHAITINKMEKVELEVFRSNTAAMRLYEVEGFVIEGEKVDSRKIDGVYDNIVMMGMKLKNYSRLSLK